MFVLEIECEGLPTLEQTEKALIIAALKHHGGNRTHAAYDLQIALRTLRNKISMYYLRDQFPTRRKEVTAS